MPNGPYFSYVVIVGGKCLPETKGEDGRTYIETDLDVPGVSFTKSEYVVTIYGENELQSSPVTPYQVEITVHHGPDPERWYWFDMYVDGSRVWNKPLKNGTKIWVSYDTKSLGGTLSSLGQIDNFLSFTLPKSIMGFTGVKHYQFVNWRVEGTMDRTAGAFREFLFSLPRYQRDKLDQIEDGRKGAIGTIAITCKEAIFDGYRKQFFSDRDKTFRGEGLNARSDFFQATKADCSGGGLLTTATGRELFRFKEGGRLGMIARYRRGEQLAELNLHYRMRCTRIDMGLSKESQPNDYASKMNESLVQPMASDNNLSDVNATTADNDNNNCKVETMNEEHVECRKEQVDELNDSLEIIRISPARPSRISTKKCPVKTDVLKPIKTRITQEIIVRRNDKGEEEKMTRLVESLPLHSYVRVDDDLFVVENLDDSVIFLGDDDCCVIDPPVQEFPYVELE